MRQLLQRNNNPRYTASSIVLLIPMQSDERKKDFGNASVQLLAFFPTQFPVSFTKLKGQWKWQIRRENHWSSFICIIISPGWCITVALVQPNIARKKYCPLLFREMEIILCASIFVVKASVKPNLSDLSGLYYSFSEPLFSMEISINKSYYLFAKWFMLMIDSN